jgi:hypothetical protein
MILYNQYLVRFNDWGVIPLLCSIEPKKLNSNKNPDTCKPNRGNRIGPLSATSISHQGRRKRRWCLMPVPTNGWVYIDVAWCGSIIGRINNV